VKSKGIPQKILEGLEEISEGISKNGVDVDDILASTVI